MLIPVLKYYILTLKHKWFVLIAGIKIGVPLWRLILHDWSKLLPWNAYYYGQQFFGNKSSDKFDHVWLKHQNLHDHHWEYWIPRTLHNRSKSSNVENKPMPMEYDAILEMIADWIGASRVYSGYWPTMNSWDWFHQNFPKIRVHPKTREIILNVLKEKL